MIGVLVINFEFDLTDYLIFDGRGGGGGWVESKKISSKHFTFKKNRA